MVTSAMPGVYVRSPCETPVVCSAKRLPQFIRHRLVELQVQVPRSSFRPRLPLAGEPVRSSLDALAIVSLAISRPLEAETIAFFLDQAGRSDTITVVTNTVEPDSVLAVAECMALAGGGVPSWCGLVLASVRPEDAGCMP